MSVPGSEQDRRYDPFEAPIRLSSTRLRVPLWWAGWRPILTMAIALLVGSGLGSVVATWRLRWLDTVGGGGVSADVTTPTAYAVSVLVAYAPGFAVIALCLAIGVGVWRWGCREINRHYEPVVASFFDGVSIPTTDAWAYTLRMGVGGGSPPLVEPGKRYLATHILLGDDAMAIHEGSLDLVRRRLNLGERADTLGYADIASARYEGSCLEVETTNGEIRRYECDPSHEPTPALRDLRERVERSHSTC